MTTQSETPQSNPFDAYAPAEIALRVEKVGVAKARMTLIQTATLGVVAGAFISLGAALFTLVMTGNEFGLGPGRLLGGVAFSMGLILVVVGGAELFTGNNLIVLAWADRLVTTGELLRNWVIVYLANMVGALGTVVLIHLSGVLELGGGQVAQTAVAFAEAKVGLGFVEALTRGILCNVLVCLAVWLCFAARTVSGKILSIVFPIAGFVALGFEHSVANMYLIPIGWLAGGDGVTLMGFLGNLVPVTLGNIIGGGVLVAAVYWLVYRRGAG